MFKNGIIMKKIFALALSLLLTIGAALFAQKTESLRGVYLNSQGTMRSVWLMVDGYFSRTDYYTDQGYEATIGGPYTYDGKTFTFTVEYDDTGEIAVGEAISCPVSREGDSFRFDGLFDGIRLVKQPAKKQKLDGLWRITGRRQGDGGQMATIQRGDRKTIKLLVDGYFQWIAINPAEKGFYGTGGGHYTFQKGKYSEHIQFFSRDNSRAGAHLTFDGEIKKGDWHHSGLSSKGDPIYEIWSRDK